MISPSYKLLLPGELIEAKDEWFDNAVKRWKKTKCKGSVLNSTYPLYRRRVKRVKVKI